MRLYTAYLERKAIRLLKESGKPVADCGEKYYSEEVLEIVNLLKAGESMENIVDRIGEM